MEYEKHEKDQCGRCGCSRESHTPACKDHPKCKHFSEPKVYKHGKKK